MMLVYGSWQGPLLSVEEENAVADEPEELKNRRMLHEERIAKAIKPVNDRYRRDLELMMNSYTRARDLDSSLAVSNELKILDGGEEAAESVKTDNSRLVDLRKNHKAALQRIQAPANEQYLRDLEGMIEDFTRARDLDAALAVRSEFQRLEREQQGADPDGLGAWLQSHLLTWKGQSGYVEISFDGRKARVSADGREIMERPYSIKGEDSVEFEWSANDVNSFTLSKDRRSFVRSSSAGGANHGGEVKSR